MADEYNSNFRPALVTILDTDNTDTINPTSRSLPNAKSQDVSIVDGSGNQITSFGNGLVPESYDYIALTYVAAGNGAGEVETAIYKTEGSGGTTVATLTLTYNASNEIATVTKT